MRGKKYLLVIGLVLLILFVTYTRLKDDKFNTDFTYQTLNSIAGASISSLNNVKNIIKAKDKEIFVNRIADITSTQSFSLNDDYQFINVFKERSLNKLIEVRNKVLEEGLKYIGYTPTPMISNSDNPCKEVE